MSASTDARNLLLVYLSNQKIDMKHLLFLAGILFYSSSTLAQSDKIILGTIDLIHSNILGEDRKIWVYVPNSYAQTIYAPERYPVIYLLDGDAHFYSVVGMTQQFSSVNGNTICPEMIVVGITNTDRTRDLTPTHVDSDPPYMDSNAMVRSGGAEKFTGFIEKELMPYIDSTYPTQPYKMLIGHSFGGLYVMNTLLNHPRLFNAYVAIDPSMWWEREKYLSKVTEGLSKTNLKGISLFLGIANTMSEGMDTLTVQSDTAASNRHIRSILKMNNFLSGNNQSMLKFKSKYYSDDDHGSIPLIAEYDAFHFIFSYYPLKLNLDENLNMDKRVIAKIQKHYKSISDEFGYKVIIPEPLANNMGYRALRPGNYDISEYFFRLNIINYPGSANAFDSYGDYFAATGNKAKAIENYTKSLQLKEVGETRIKLLNLQGK